MVAMRGSKSKPLDRRVFYDGGVIFAEGADSGVAFIVEDGQVRLIQHAGSEHETELALVGRGQIFGEMSLFDGGQHMATAKAIGTTVVVAVDQSSFNHKLTGLDEETRKYLEMLIEYCRNTPIHEEREGDPELAAETKFDTLVRHALDSRCLLAAEQHEDPFLASFANRLVSYARRRLPPENPPQ